MLNNSHDVKVAPASNATSEDEAYEYEYDYDLGESLSTYNWLELAPCLLVYSLTLLLGLVGNLLILIAVVRHTHVKHSPVNVFLGSLASADLLLIGICLPLKVRMGLCDALGGAHNKPRAAFSMKSTK